MRITVQVETWDSCVAEMRAVWPKHWEEIALDKDTILQDMDEDRYKQMDTIGMLHITTVRADSILVGYAINFVITHYHYKSSGLMSMADMYYILPEYSVVGARMFAEMERSLRDRGVVRGHMSCKVHQDHQALFERLGWEFTDKTFSKLFKGR